MAIVTSTLGESHGRTPATRDSARTSAGARNLPESPLRSLSLVLPQPPWWWPKRCGYCTAGPAYLGIKLSLSDPNSVSAIRNGNYTAQDSAGIAFCEAETEGEELIALADGSDQ